MTASSSPASVGLRAGIIILVLGTASIHLTLNFPDPVFILNGLGYLALLAALYLPFRRRWRAVGTPCGGRWSGSRRSPFSCGS